MTQGILDLSPFERMQFDPFDNTEPGFAVCEVSDATVTRSGISFRGVVPVWASLPPHRQRWPRQVMLAWGSRLKRPAVRLPDGPVYGLVHSIWSGGYYHWLLESLPRLLALEAAAGRDVVPLIPDYARLHRVYRESLSALGYGHAVPMPPGASAKVARLLVPQAPALGQYAPGLIRRLRARLVAAALPGGEQPPHRKLYISRARARARKVANEDEVRHLLDARGFEPVFLEEMDFLSQVRLFSQAEIVVGQHGAGLSNLLFMQPGTRLVEMHRKLVGNHKSEYTRVLLSYRYFSGYAKLAVLNGLRYQVLICEAAHPPVKLDTDNILVDVSRLAATLDASSPVAP